MGKGTGWGLRLGEEGRGETVEELDSIKKWAGVAAVAVVAAILEAAAELLDLVVALPNGFGRDTAFMAVQSGAPDRRRGGAPCRPMRRGSHWSSNTRVAAEGRGDFVRICIAYLVSFSA